jgi:hypothetical protein
MAALISRGLRRHTERRAAVLGVDLQDAREEVFVRMVCDGLALGVAFARAGFTSRHKTAAANLFNLPRVQERARAILEARRSTGVVTLPQVTDMLQRVFAGAHSEGEYSAAHNAAFSLARLYGHVTDKSTLEVIRRPSRDPDAPSEQALSAWVEALPALAGPGPGLGPLPDGPSFLRVSDAPAGLLGPDLAIPHPDTVIPHPDTAGPAGPGPQGPELSNEINWLGLDGSPAPVRGRPENGAPAPTVTGTPNPCGSAGLLGPGGPYSTPFKKEGLIEDEGTTPSRGDSTNTGENKWPSAEELFG